MIRIIVPVYNAEPWIEKCIKSIMSQSYHNWTCHVTDDCSVDNTASIIRSINDHRIVKVFNQQRQFTLHNIAATIDNNKFDDEDIIMVVDGDDWLAHNGVFDRVLTEYEYGAWSTYGQIAFLSGRSNDTDRRLHADIGKYRKDNMWVMTALRTFKVHLWNRIDRKDLLDVDGNYFKTSGDVAFMFPIAEMCGHDKIKFIPDVIYLYNDQNPIGDNKINQNDQNRTGCLILNKPCYERIIV